ncbi:MAG TPA: serine/threonine-protein kinase [Streptosporangiaceae bacterium]|nr:serine/threonine-protein kinase [Streptosporangiaceae bacterium]
MNGEIPPAIGDFPAGAQIASYRIDRLIGRGGMATVYRATDVRLDRQVALKVLIPELARNETFRQRFILESRAGASLDHPHVIPVFEAGETDGVLFIAMRYVPGLDVRALIDREGQLPADRTVSIVSQVASALDAAHEHGLVHRDVKPANMLMAQTQDSGGTDYVYLSDFGLSKQSLSSTSLTGTGQFLGTLDYMSPEQISGRTVDGRTDLYALGCATFEMLAGQPPFRREANLAVMWAQVSAEPPSVRQWRPELPAAVDAVLGQALAKSPDDRQASCTDFAQALRSACAAPSARAGAAGTGSAGAAGSQAGMGTAGSPTPPVHPATELAFGAVGGLIAGGAAAAGPGVGEGAGPGTAGPGTAGPGSAGPGSAGPGAGGPGAGGPGVGGPAVGGPGVGGPAVGGPGLGDAAADVTVSRLPDGGQAPGPGGYQPGGYQPGGYQPGAGGDQAGSGDQAGAAGYQAGLAATGPVPAVGGYSPSGQTPGAGSAGSGYDQGGASGPGYGAADAGYGQAGSGGAGYGGSGYGAAGGSGYGAGGYGSGGAGGPGGPAYGGGSGYGAGGSGAPSASGYGAGYATNPSGPGAGAAGYGAGGQQYGPGGTAYAPGSPSGYGFPQDSPQPPKRGKALPILIGILVVIILAGVGITILHLRTTSSTQANSHHTKAITASPSKSPSSTPTSTPSTSATSTPTVLGPAATIKAYYAAVNNQQYARAWALNTSAHALSSYSTYKAGFAGTQDVALTVTGVSGDVVSVSFIAYQTDGSQKDYSGDYTVQNGKITGSSIEQTN